MAKHEKRIRRTPEEARTLILDAAEKIGGGPAGLRLQDVAKAAGVSHPTILHHFGSREGLIRALNLRALENLTEAVVDRIGNDERGRGGIARTFAAYRDGMAERLIWLLQSGALPPDGPLPLFEKIVERLQAERVRLALPGHEPDIADTRHVVHLTAVAALGDALMGRRLRHGSGDTAEAFEHFLAGLIEDFVNARR